MMLRPSIPPLARGIALGLAAVAALVGFAFWLNRGSQTRLDGSVLKVRTIASDQAASIAVIDFRLNNPARALFLVREITVEVIKADGNPVEGLTIAEPDLDRVLAYYPLTGPRFNPVLKTRDRIRQGDSFDRTVAASFSISEQDLQNRRGLLIRIVDADGAVVEIGGKAPR